MSARTRNGKIARLPRSIREQLNQRLADGAQARTILPWLHEKPLVKEVLEKQFGGRPVTEDNLSEWRQGGFKDWLQQQEAREALRSMVEEAEAMNDVCDKQSPLDHAVVLATAALMRTLKAVGNGADSFKDAALRRELREIAHELTQLRRVESEAKLAQLKQEQWETEEERQETAETEREMKAMHRQSEMFPFLASVTASRRNDVVKMLTKNLPPEAAAEMEKHCRACWEGLPLVYNRYTADIDNYLAGGFNRTESEPIGPDSGGSSSEKQ